MTTHERLHHTDTGQNNTIILNGDIRLSGITVNTSGNHNTILFNGDINGRGSISLNIPTSNNIIEFGPDVYVQNKLGIGFMVPYHGPQGNCKLHIGNKTFFNGNVSIRLLDHAAHVHMAKDVFSREI